MRLTLKLVDQRTKPSTYTYSNPESEDYDRAEFDLAGSARVIAGALRTLADDIDPSNGDGPSINSTFNYGGVVR